MTRPLKRILFTIGGTLALLALLAAAALLFVDVNRYKPRLEAAASHALGMDVQIGGIGMRLFPRLHITAKDVRILNDHGVAVASAKKARLGIELLPLLRKEFRLRSVELTHLELSVERGPEGGFNVEGMQKAALLRALNGASVALSDATVLYTDRRSGHGFVATDLDLSLSRIRFAGGTGPQPLNGLSLEGKLSCGEIRAKDFSVAALKGAIDGKDGVFVFEPVTMRIFGGKASGTLRADVSGPVPLYQVHCSLPSFRIEEFLKILSPKKAAEGAMDFSASLSMRGKIWSELVESTAGEMSLRSSHLTLVDNDIDRAVSRFESSQNFNLADVSAVFLAGPLGLAVTKGYNFAGLFQGSGGNSSIGPVVSDWRVEHGVAHAKDVAMATTRNRIALQGGLDFVHERFADVTVAVVDAGGCARVRQEIRGPFAKPVVQKPHFLTSLTGPVVKVFREARHVFPDRPCEVFYAGSVAPPR